MTGGLITTSPVTGGIITTSPVIGGIITTSPVAGGINPPSPSTPLGQHTAPLDVSSPKYSAPSRRTYGASLRRIAGASQSRSLKNIVHQIVSLISLSTWAPGLAKVDKGSTYMYANIQRYCDYLCSKRPALVKDILSISELVGGPCRDKVLTSPLSACDLHREHLPSLVTVSRLFSLLLFIFQ